MKLDVLYEDNHLIAVYKPAGILAQEDYSGELPIADYVKDYIKEKYQKPGNVFIGLLHRLDRPVSGIILLAKTSKGAARLSEQFRLGTITKIYHAVVEGKPLKSKDTLVHYLEKVGEKSHVSVVYDAPRGNTVKADLSYEVVNSNGKFSLLKINLGTGKFHQIRSQLAHIGHPIVGDVKYGAKSPLPDQSILLRATTLSFKTATGDETRTITIDPPQLP